MRITLGDHIVEINERTTTNNQHRVLTSSQKGIVSQDEYFNKQIASKENTGYKIVKRGQFTYRAMSDTGRFYINRLMEYDVGIVSPAYPVFEVIEDNIIYTPYIVLFFESDYFQSLIVNQSTGSTRVSLKLDKIKRISIDIPSYQEQKEIVEKIESAKRAIAARDEQLSCFNELVKSRFIELFGDPVDNPKGWKKDKAENYIDLLSGFPFDSSKYTESGVNICGGLIIMPQRIEWGDCKHWCSIDGYEEYALNENDIVIALDRPWISEGFKIAMVEAEHLPALLIQRTARIRAIGLNQFYLMYCFLLGGFDKHCNVTGSLVPHISAKDIRSFAIMLPPIDLQEQFATFVEQTDKSKLAVQKALEELEILKKSLMQQYFG